MQNNSESEAGQKIVSKLPAVPEKWCQWGRYAIPPSSFHWLDRTQADIRLDDQIALLLVDRYSKVLPNVTVLQLQSGSPSLACKFSAWIDHIKIVLLCSTATIDVRDLPRGSPIHLYCLFYSSFSRTLLVTATYVHQASWSSSYTFCPSWRRQCIFCLRIVPPVAFREV